MQHDLCTAWHETRGEELARHANQFGFNKLVPFDLETLVSFFPDDGSLNDNLPATAQSAIGQLDVQTTPLLVALSGAAVANGGEMMVPYLVYDIFTSDGTVESSTVPMVWRRAMSPATASVLSGLMEQAVVSGTGKKAAVPGVRIAGKTGTAQVTGKAPTHGSSGSVPWSPSLTSNRSSSPWSSNREATSVSLQPAEALRPPLRKGACDLL